MKRVDLAKSLGLKIRGQMMHSAAPSRFGAGASTLPDKREQRKLDQAAGLVPFAVKIHESLARRLRDLAGEEGIGLNELTARILEAGLAGQTAAAQQAPAKPSAKAAVKKAASKKAPTGKPGAEEPATTKAPAQEAAARKAPAKKAPAKKASAKAAQAAKAAR